MGGHIMVNNIGHSDIALKSSSLTQLKLDTENKIQEKSLSKTHRKLGHTEDISKKVNSNITNNEITKSKR